MTAPGTFERVYSAIKARLRAGELRPGDRLEPAQLSQTLNASVTPVRDALHRMTGERLVEAPLHEGFRVPLLNETMLRHLYAWHRDLLMLAVARRTISAQDFLADGDQAEPEPELLARQQRAFLSLAQTTGNPEHVLAIRALLERLEPYQHIESKLLDSLETETTAIADAVHRGDRKMLRRLLVQYHRRRSRIVPEIVALVGGP